MAKKSAGSPSIESPLTPSAEKKSDKKAKAAERDRDAAALAKAKKKAKAAAQKAADKLKLAARAEAEKAKKKAKKAKKREQERAAERAKAARKAEKLAAKKAEAKRAVVAARPAPADEFPNATWTVVALRARARERGLPGYSRLSKEQLIELVNS